MEFSVFIGYAKKENSYKVVSLSPEDLWVWADIVDICILDTQNISFYMSNNYDFICFKLVES